MIRVSLATLLLPVLGIHFELELEHFDDVCAVKVVKAQKIFEKVLDGQLSGKH